MPSGSIGGGCGKAIFLFEGVLVKVDLPLFPGLVFWNFILFVSPFHVAIDISHFNGKLKLVCMVNC